MKAIIFSILLFPLLLVTDLGNCQDTVVSAWDFIQKTVDNARSESKIKRTSQECEIIVYNKNVRSVSEMIVGVMSVREDLGMFSKFMGGVGVFGVFDFAINPACADAANSMSKYYKAHPDLLEKLAHINESSLKVFAADDPDLIQMVQEIKNKKAR